jgi:hypothetical protein
MESYSISEKSYMTSKGYVGEDREGRLRKGTTGIMTMGSR